MADHTHVAGALPPDGDRGVRLKGQRVFPDCGQREPDDTRDHAVDAPNRDEVNARLARASRRAREPRHPEDEPDGI